MPILWLSACATRGEWKSLKSSSNFQNIARQTRYNFFQEVALDHNAPWIVTAHHLDDQAETVLLKLFGGSTIKGLAGMALKEGNIVDHYSIYPVPICLLMLNNIAFHGERTSRIPP